jgi:hypothetical protein
MSTILAMGQIERITAFISATKGSTKPKSDSNDITGLGLLMKPPQACSSDEL